MLSARSARGTTVNKPDSQITLPVFETIKWVWQQWKQNIMRYIYFNTGEKWRPVIPLKNSFNKKEQHLLSKYLFSQLGLLHEASYFKCWGTQVNVVTRLRA
jgi:hypothetical protein